VSREIDALVAEKVMGYGAHTKPCRARKSGLGCACCDKIDYYSTDIAAAFQVVEKMMGDQYDYIFRLDQLCGRQAPGRWWAYFDKGLDRFSGYGQDAPMAICLAALAALGVEPPKEKR
jgi:hypothetical protein